MIFHRERLIGVTVGLVLGFVAFVYGLRWLEASMTFQPDRMTERKETPFPKAQKAFGSTRRMGLACMVGFFWKSGPAEIATVIFFHGNGGNIGNVSWWTNGSQNEDSTFCFSIIAVTEQVMELLLTNQIFMQTAMQQ